jgi:hypothetical protein
MNDHTPCECGQPALTDDDGFVTQIFNGMCQMPVCDDCWRDPENIALEVCVQAAIHALAERLPHDVPFARLATPVVTAMSDAADEAYAARGITDDGTIAKLIATRWDEWYAVN